MAARQGNERWGKPDRPIARRGVLKAGLAVGAWPAPARGPATANGRPLRQPGSLPYPELPAGTDTIPQIEHIVVLMMENHSYDNRLGMLVRPWRGRVPARQARACRPPPTRIRTGRSSTRSGCPPRASCRRGPARSGRPATTPTTTGGWTDSSAPRSTRSRRRSSAAWPWATGRGKTSRSTTPLYRHFPIADRYFCSVLGQTYPNRRYLLAATSLGQIDDPGASLTDYPANGTIFDQFDAHGITWKDYFTSTPSTELFPQLYLKNAGTKVVPISGLLHRRGGRDAAGLLPGRARLRDPVRGEPAEHRRRRAVRGERDQRCHQRSRLGPHGCSSSPMTSTAATTTTCRRPPPSRLTASARPCCPERTASTGSPGTGSGYRSRSFRPWARPHYVSHRVYDHTSILKLVETKWNLPALTYRDANAAAMLDMLDLRRPAFAEPPDLAQPLAVTDPSALSCSVNGPGTIPPPGSVTG